MPLNEKKVTEAIVKRYTEKLLDHLKCDVVIVGAGPSGLVAAAKLAQADWKTVVFEKRLSVGGGMWGGGMMMNEIVVQDIGKEILDEFGIESVLSSKEYYTADAIEAVCSIGARAVKSGARIFNLVTVEDLVIKNNRAAGVVINWSTAEMSGLPIDPLTVESKYVVDATGHHAEIVRLLDRKGDARLMTPTGRVEGERSLWTDKAEQSTLDNTREVFPNVFVTGMCANATFGSHRMGPIFGGMLKSGEKVARIISEKLGKGEDPT
ncbi:MAG: thiazole biosynthesis protein [Candidatus Latescibacteria bacterium]|nr:thiazole biosynthesis protein [bacterium]MBD3424010.1 thiazole biosynthesis protein [Candidatus Latescibacterota bacterium]